MKWVLGLLAVLVLLGGYALYDHIARGRQVEQCRYLAPGRAEECLVARYDWSLNAARVVGLAEARAWADSLRAGNHVRDSVSAVQSRRPPMPVTAAPVGTHWCLPPGAVTWETCPN
jgi:hypothetical protein